MSMFGLTETDLDDNAIELWPDTADSVLVFVAMQTQWRQGFAGPTGLDYAALGAVLRLRSIPRARHGDVFEDVRAMEAETLNLMHAKDKQ
jgi:hypothetical protein